MATLKAVLLLSGAAVLGIVALALGANAVENDPTAVAMVGGAAALFGAIAVVAAKARA